LKKAKYDGLKRDFQVGQANVAKGMAEIVSSKALRFQEVTSAKNPIHFPEYFPKILAISFPTLSSKCFA